MKASLLDAEGKCYDSDQGVEDPNTFNDCMETWMITNGFSSDDLALMYPCNE